MEITQIKYFLNVAETEHMTASAEKLHIAQPALSQAIHRFESDLGVPLFEKKGRNICLTQYGKYAQMKLLPIIQELESMPEDLKAMAHIEHHTVYINVLAASSLLTKAIIKYRDNHKDVNFKLQQNEAAEIVDIQITTKLFYQQSEENDESQYIYNEKIFLAVPNQERFASKANISLKEVAEEGFISLAGSRQFRYICDKFCHYAGIKPNYVFESDSPAAVQDMIAANMGVGFWPEHSWGKIKNTKIKLLPIRDPECSRDLIVCYNERSNSNYALDFYRFFTNMLKKM